MKSGTFASDRDAVNALECLLFVAETPLPRKRLAELLQASEKEVQRWLEQLRERLDGTGLQVVEMAGGYRLATRPEYAAFVERYWRPPPVRLSQAALEVLAIIAYRQPITRVEVDALRGVGSHSAVRTLLEHGLIEPCGRKPAPGRPILYRTTTKFLDVFGLRDLSDLPEVAEDLGWKEEGTEAKP
jgi:segregation and condensation protein B